MEDQVRLLRHIEGLAKKGGNNVCAECPERHPTWASLIKPVVKGGSKMGVFICQRCYKHHFALGTSICEVKSLSMATEWSVADAEILAKTGNVLVNSIYEAHGKWEDDKEIITYDEREEAKQRLEYVKNKYAMRQYFSEEKFNNVMVTISPAFKEMMENQRKSKDEADIAALGVTPPRFNRRRFSLAGVVSNGINLDILATPRKTKAENNPTIATPLQRVKRNQISSSEHSNQIKKQHAAAVATLSVTPPQRVNHRRFSLTGGVNDDIDPNILATPRKPKEEINPAIMATPMRTTNPPTYKQSIEPAHQERNTKDRASPPQPMNNIAIPETPRRSARRRANSSANNDAYARSQLSLFASAGPTARLNGADLDIIKDADKMEDYLKTPRSRRKMQHAPAPSSGPERMGLQKSPSDRSLRSNRGTSQSRARQGSEGGHTASSSTNGSDRSQRTRRRATMETSMAASNLSDNSGHERNDAIIQLPSSLALVNSSSHSTPMRPGLGRKSSSRRITEVEEEDQDPNENHYVASPLDRRRACLQQANKQLSHRSLMAKSASDRNLGKSPRADKHRVGMSVRESRTTGDLFTKRERSTREARSIDGASRRGERSADSSHRGSRSTDGSRREARSVDHSRRGDRSVDNSSRRGDRTLESSARRERVLDASRRGERSLESSTRKERILDPNPRKDRPRERTSDASSRKERKSVSRPPVMGEPDMDWSAGATDRKGSQSSNNRISRTKSKEGGIITSIDDDRSRKSSRSNRKDGQKLPSRRKTIAVGGALEASPGIKSMKPRGRGTSEDLVDIKSNPSSLEQQKAVNLDGSGNSNLSDSKDGKKHRRRNKEKASSTEKTKKRSTGQSGSRRHSAGDVGGSFSDSSDDEAVRRRSREDSKPDHKAAKVLSGRRMMRSVSTSEIESEVESDDEGHAIQGRKPDRRGSSSGGMRRSYSASSLSGSSDLEGADKPARRGKKKDQLEAAGHEYSSRSEKKFIGAKYKQLDTSVFSSGYTGGSLGLVMTNSQLGTKHGVNEKVAAAAEAVAIAVAAGRRNNSGSSKDGRLNVIKSGTTGAQEVLSRNGTPSQNASEAFALKNFDFKNKLVNQWVANTSNKQSSSDGAAQPTETTTTRNQSLRNKVVTPLMSVMTASHDHKNGVTTRNSPGAEKGKKSSISPKSVVGDKKAVESFEDAIVAQWLKA